MSDVKLYLPLLGYGGYHGAFVRSWTMLTHTLRDAGISFAVPPSLDSESLITRGRNRVANAFLKSDCTHLLFVDADIVFDPQIVLDLLEASLDFVGVPYPAKTMTPGANLTIGVPLEGVYAKGAEYIPAKDVGTGFLLLSRRVFETLRPIVATYETDLIGGDVETHSAYFDCGIADRQYISEDWWFSRLYRLAGGSCFLSMRHRVKHIGPHAYEAPSLGEQLEKDYE